MFEMFLVSDARRFVNKTYPTKHTRRKGSHTETRTETACERPMRFSRVDCQQKLYELHTEILASRCAFVAPVRTLAREKDHMTMQRRKCSECTKFEEKNVSFGSAVCTYMYEQRGEVHTHRLAGIDFLWLETLWFATLQKRARLLLYAGFCTTAICTPSIVPTDTV